MTVFREDIIVAQATPPGPGALAIVRLSGSSLLPLASRILRPGTLEPRRATLCTIIHPVSSQILDQAVVTYFPAPNSYTGEDVLEITTHGGDFVPQSIIQALMSDGIRLADPGEFSYRAFLNGRIDLVQAEAIATLISTKTELGADVSLRSVTGKLSRHLNQLKTNMLDLLTVIEHELDFSEEEITFTERNQILSQLTETQQNLKAVLETAVFGKTVKHGLRVALVGQPNTGKSSIFNNLLGHERALVSEIAGTTRDTIESWVDLGGFPVCLVDTAGYWDSEDYLESLGIERTAKEIDQADLILFIDEQNPEEVWRSLHLDFPQERIIFVKSKEDLHPGSHRNRDVVYTSSKEDTGFSNLSKTIVYNINKHFGNIRRENPVLISSRQRLLVRQASVIMEDIVSQTEKGLELDITASLLREFVAVIQDVTGEITDREIIENIFSSFCVGK